MESKTSDYTQGFNEISEDFVKQGYNQVEAHNMAYQAKLYAERSKQLEQMRLAEFAKALSDFRKMKR